MEFVILSPHLDDAALSCWRRLSGPDSVRVINVFAGVPPAGATSWWDRLGGATSSTARMHERIEEDRSALASLGRTATNLEFLDRQYRDRRQPPTRLLQAAIRDELGAQCRVLAPAALSTHPDHRAVRDIGLALARSGITVSLYADLPHASARGWPPWVTDGDPRGREVAERWATRLPPHVADPTVWRLSSAEHERKLALVRMYGTQIASLEADFGRSIDDPSLLGYEVEWALAADL